MKIERKMFSGMMNLDDPNEAMPSSSHKEAFNVTFRGNPGDMRIENIKGNQSVANAGLQSGTNVCIGSYYDELKQRVFYFVYNSNGYDAIFVYNTITRGISTLLMSKIDSLSTEALFNFSPDYPIASVNIIYRTEDDGDILHWTDRNNRPMKLNIKEAEAVNKTYNGNWKKKYLTVARPMPLVSAICKYESDATTTINNLRSKLYQFRYRWIYRDFSKSTWSPWSRLFAPDNVDILADEIDPTKNNRISIKYQTGDDDVLKVEIAARQSIDTTFSDPFLVETVDKTGLPDNSEYEYKFYNTEAYPYVDVSESNQLFDYTPLKANAQELLNGNVLIYGGVTEGRTANVTPSVTKTLSLVQNTNTATALTMASYNRYTFTYYPTYNVTGGAHYIIFSGIPNVGDVYNFTLSFRRDIGAGVESTSVNFGITVAAGRNTQQFLEADLLAIVVADATLQNYTLASYVTTLQLVEPGEFNGKRGLKFSGNPSSEAWVLDSYSFTYTYAGGGGLPADPTGVNTACYKHKSRYTFGMCYFDEYGVTNGVITNDSFRVVTPEIDSADLSGTQLTVPLIEFQVSHQAPSWAKYFSFVRTTNLTTSDFKTIVTTTTGVDLANKYAYLDITEYQENKNGYPAYSFAKGDRVRIVGRKNQPDLLTDSVSNDYPILALLKSSEITSMTTPASVPANKIWLRIPYDNSTMSFFTFGNASYYNYYIEVYTPAINASEEAQLFYEFGEIYPVIESGVNRYHTGMTQNQTASVPAIYKFIRGDVYSRLRDSAWIIDKSMSDKYGSKVDGNGRPFVVDEYAKEAYYPTLVRYSLEYQSGTSINQTNRFYAANFDEYDRERGDIQRLKTRGRQLRVFQNRACGMVPILQSVVQTADGSGVLSQSAEIINKIQYYLGDYGLGNQFCSLTSSANADYFTDPVRGAQVRLSTDGLTPISELYKAHFYLNPLITKYNKSRNNITNQGKAKIISIYDQFNEEVVTVMQESVAGDDKSNPYTIGFNEFRNSYTSFYDYSPEWIICAENLIISWKNGILYTHDSSTYCNFYGVQYKPNVTLIFNQFESVKKRYNTITMLANTAWVPESNGDITTNLNQTSSLQTTDFITKDDKIHAAFKRDSTSTGGLYNGNVLKGNWAKLKLKPSIGSIFVNLYYIELSILEPFYNR
jgi:hypothetical protein